MDAARQKVYPEHRWVVERPLAEVFQNRHMAKRYQEREETTEVCMYLAMIPVM